VIEGLDAFKERFGIERISSGYGSTEASTVTFAPGGLAVPGQCGFVRDDYELRLVDENDMDVAPGQMGEAIVRPREPWCSTLGYFNAPEATAKSWRNLWFHTGDLLRLADSGQYVFCDRNNDAIRRRGENISSFEVEREIDAHAAVLESAVIKAPSDHGDDEVKACVVLREGSTVSFAELVVHLERRLPAFMVPRYYELVEALPRTPTEKVQKAKLRDDALNARTWDRNAAAPIGSRAA
jgi:carnitine-CoA ligase